MTTRSLSRWLSLLLVFALATGLVGGGATAQDTPPKKPVKEEEEDTTPKRPAGQAPVNYGAPINLIEESRKAEHPALKKFLQDFSRVHDAVTTVNGKTFQVDPLADRYDANRAGDLRYKAIKDGIAGETASMPREQIRSVVHYELLALDEARKLVNSGLDQASGPGGKPAVTRYRLLRVAEMVVSEALRFHGTARQSKARDKGWDGLETELRSELLKLQLAAGHALIADGDWPAAEALVKHLHSKDMGNREILAVVEKVYLGQSELALAKNDNARARERMEFLLKNFHNEITPGVDRIQKILQERARQLVAQSKDASAKGQASLALQHLEEAERTWPKLEGLGDLRRQNLKSYQVLRIGVRNLPAQMSPTTAETDADRLAVRLIFDNLFSLRAGPSARDGYQFKLGAEPQATSQGWEIVLPRDIQWSDGKPFTARDIDRSFEIMTDPRSPYYNPLAKDLVELRTADQYRMTLTVKRGYLDPLALMCFDILPAHLLTPDRTPRNLAFGKSPVGTGPFVFKGIEGDEAIFTANPNYRRPHAPDGPIIKEIRLIKYTDFAQARQALSNGTLQMVLDLTSQEKEQLAGIGRVDVFTPTEPREPVPPYLSNPRVYFLVPNFRQNSLANLSLRQAISAGIDREKILNDLFRGRERKHHQVLNGPFPVGSWAYNPDFNPDKSNPFKREQAVALMNKARAALGGPPSLSLRHSTSDPTAAPACAMIKSMLEPLGMQIKVEPMTHQQLMAELAKDKPAFDLLYWAHDFDNETLSLWPLFDPSGMGENGRNFMGFERDSQVEGKFRELEKRRDFEFLRQQTHFLHDLITVQRTALIPLWQLDKHVAVHRSLKVSRLHPIYIVDNIEEWQLRTGE